MSFHISLSMHSKKIQSDYAVLGAMDMNEVSPFRCYLIVHELIVFFILNSIYVEVQKNYSVKWTTYLTFK